jgi:hypothetical protein
MPLRTRKSVPPPARRNILSPIAAVASSVPIAFTLALLPAPALAGKAQWSIFEDHAKLVRSSASTRARTLSEIGALGADTIRIEVRWSEVAPAPLQRSRPSFDASDPGAYPGFGPYDDLITRAVAQHFRVLLTITGDAPRWATAGGLGRSFATANYKPSAGEYGRFAGAVAKRYSGRFGGLPAVYYFTIWNEPNHKQFLKPQRSAPGIYRKLVDEAIPEIRRNAAGGAKVFVGETAPVGRAGKVIGPKAFLRRWLCLDKRFRSVRSGSCSHFKRIDADGYAHHPYGPADRVPRKADIINMLAIRKLGKYLDLARRAHRFSRRLPIYSTEFGLQSNPPDTTVSTTPVRQAALINEKEEYSYRYPRLKSYSQYLLQDDPPRAGPRSARWSGFQTGLRFPNGRKKPAYNAYGFPIVVHQRGRHGVRIWGRVRPGGSSPRAVRLYSGGRRSGGAIRTNSRGYFGARRSRNGRYRFKAYVYGAGGKLVLIGKSRTARPIR